MVLLEDLKKIILLGNLTEEMREKLLPHIDMRNYEEEESIFREGDNANRLYMLKRGKVLLEKRVSEKIAISFGSVKEGYTFGWSAMLDEGPYTSDAICAAPCEVLYMRREKLMRQMDNDHDLGYIFTQRMLRVMKKRLDLRTDQFLRSIINQPDLQHLFEA